MPKMTDEQLLRAADLHWAYQLAEEAVKGDTTAEAEFKSKCAGDAEAEREFQRGMAEQQARQIGVATSIH